MTSHIGVYVLRMKIFCNIMIFRETLIHIQLFQKNSVKLKQDFNNSYGKFFAAFFFDFYPNVLGLLYPL